MLPSNVLVVLLVAGLLIGLRQARRRMGLVLCWTAVLGLIVLGYSPATNWLILPLEERYPRPASVEAVDGIIVLGGAVDTIVTGGRGDTALTTSGERITVAARLAQQMPDALLIHSGGKGVIISSQATEAEGAGRLFQDFGISKDRIVLEDQSRNTWENAVLTKELINPQPGQKWLLVTSAYHMPRSMGVFEAAGWTGVAAYPVDYRTRGDADKKLWFSAASKGLRRSDITIREWIALGVYWAGGRSTAFLPGPSL
nr:YdcF family protein [Roseibium denhamense]